MDNEGVDKLNKVEPIRDVEKIEEMKKVLKNDSYRNYMMFLFGINTGLRISDILRVKVKDVKNKSHITMKTKKNNKTIKRILPPMLRHELNDFIFNKADGEFLFKSRQGENKKLSPSQAYNILKKNAEKIGLENIGTHSMRKTFAYHHYQENKDVAILQKMFRHSAPSVTLDYIGIDQDIQDKSMEGFYL